MTLKISFPNFISFLHLLPRKYKTLMVSIDGYGGSGKSTFAEMLRQNSLDITIIHNDDFYLPSSERLPREIAFQTIGADFDWQRLESQVLKKTQNDMPAFYQSIYYSNHGMFYYFCGTY